MSDRAGTLTDGDRIWLDRFMMPLPRGGTILDLGCGGGEPVARYLIDHGFRILGIDTSETLIDLARLRFPHDRWIVGDMRNVAIDEQFAGVLAWNCLSHLPRADQGAMAERAASWMQDGARLLFNAQVPDQEAMDGFRTGSRYHADLAPADYSGALATQGLVEMAHVEHDSACGGAGVWLARKL
ncbi:MAG: class I SAM-dependent methyltransferase [Sphingomonas sp.]